MKIGRVEDTQTTKWIDCHINRMRRCYWHLDCEGKVQQCFTGTMAGRWSAGALWLYGTRHLGGVAELCEGPSHVGYHRPIRRHLQSIAAHIPLTDFCTAGWRCTLFCSSQPVSSMMTSRGRRSQGALSLPHVPHFLCTPSAEHAARLSTVGGLVGEPLNMEKHPVSAESDNGGIRNLAKSACKIRLHLMNSVELIPIV